MPGELPPVERDHVHEFIPKDRMNWANGRYRLWASCVCGVEEHRFFEPSGKPTAIKYRMAGIWIDALALLRRVDLPVVVCPECHGDDDPRVPECKRCKRVGVVQADTLGPIQPKAPAPISAPSEDDSYLPDLDGLDDDLRPAGPAA